ncbi:phosphate ABC transporter permease subunit PstC [Synechococcus elongatus]|uniref:Phosphate transport system permease protein n=1 Tax=Synechococcus elongatus (strain ATCC 33912 / PCC 7942 / FACHB-805) TaxID=1140 RepID=Q31KE6_SYNE7|nr:phosphate ABC transporter permease subunit PstC [Synechococcus elongatus]ABB58473.1 Phosphate ABC transporter, permease protein PstC [Synechococcus elongatus PCC 7942 = FACHB-805]AJD57066.1 phosphate ABC transporter permease [Synechococcus elongatus UTEX 2973]MBD2587193.1 phosphate ABC transporter permease subunit PstC [Synechococcus elongatus FACHB-242]MBD2688264.1 phosphate ABC transporter permease subunit PstC [Synechococcus elongatus FACHB-1061]MBD2706025.1 phosphate ABC transporter per
MSAAAPPSRASLFKPNRERNRRNELIVKAIFGIFAFVSVLTTLGIVFTLIFETYEFFKEIPLIRFLTETRWTPLFPSAQFGIVVLLSGTFSTTLIALLVAVPLGLLSAICLSEYATPRARNLLKPALEVIAGVPSVVFGYFALLFVTPLLQSFIPGLQGFNTLSAGMVLGIAITPLVASLSEDAIFAVPSSMREGAYALGATKRETIVSVVLPAALSGIVASIVLAISRAVGETMIVAIAAGLTPNLTLNPLEPAQTMTSFIVQVSLGDTPTGSLAYKTIFAVGMTLFLLTLVLNIFSYWFVRRFQEKYE